MHVIFRISQETMLPGGGPPSSYLRSTWPSLLLIPSLHPATCFVHIVAIIMTAIMIIHIRSKYTAVGESAALVWSSRRLTPNDVGRKEIVTFFWMYALIELLAMFLDSGIIPTDNVTYTVCFSPFFLLPSPYHSPVVRCGIYGPGSICLHLFAHKWICWLPICRGRYTTISLGAFFAL